MKGFNKAMLIGNLTSDPEVKYTSGEREVAKFKVAVNRVWKDKSGKVHDEADFIPVVAWGPLAENCGKYLSKGSSVFVEGRISVRDYEDKLGNRRFFTEVVANNVTFLDSKNSTDNEHFNKKRNGYQDDTLDDISEDPDLAGPWDDELAKKNKDEEW
jgi:single-strand DNA-binding protein